MENLKEFKELIERYESITIDEIREEWRIIKRDEFLRYTSAHYTAQKLTGFGSCYTCTLCIAVNQECYQCVYGKEVVLLGCLSTENRPSYDNIDRAKTPKQLLRGFRIRAQHLKNRYKAYLLDE